MKDKDKKEVRFCFHRACQKPGNSLSNSPPTRSRLSVSKHSRGNTAAPERPDARRAPMASSACKRHASGLAYVALFESCSSQQPVAAVANLIHLRCLQHLLACNPHTDAAHFYVWQPGHGGAGAALIRDTHLITVQRPVLRLPLYLHSSSPRSLSLPFTQAALMSGLTLGATLVDSGGTCYLEI